MQKLTMPPDSPARAAFIMEGDYMEPWIRPGQVVTVSWNLPAVGECGLFRFRGETLVRQYCEDSFQNAYLLVLNRGRRELDVTVPAGEREALICLARLELDKTPPLPLF